jgi:hypothetical protein
MYYQESGTTPAELRQQLLGDRTLAMETVIDRALERGDITTAPLSPRIMALPFDLVRHEALMTLKAVPVETIIEIVDTLFLPLVNQGIRPQNRSGPPAT